MQGTDDEKGTERWFGKSWGASCCEASTHVKTPIGRPCLRCREPIRVGDQGLIHPLVHGVAEGKALVTLEPTHLDCFLKSVRPHGPDCPHCRGKDIREHTTDCQRNQTGLCTCQPMPAGRAHNPPHEGKRKA